MLFRATQEMRYVHTCQPQESTPQLVNGKCLTLNLKALKSWKRYSREKEKKEEKKNARGVSLMQSALSDKQVSKAFCILLCSNRIKWSNTEFFKDWRHNSVSSISAKPQFVKPLSLSWVEKFKLGCTSITAQLHRLFFFVQFNKAIFLINHVQVQL